MEYLDFSLENSRTQIKMFKNFIFTQRGIVYLNFLLMIWQIYILYHDPSNWVAAMCAGGVISTLFWSGAHLAMLKEDLRLEKRYLSHLIKHQDNENYKGIIKQLESSKLFYDNFYQSKQAMSMRPKSENEQ